jgi:hypothetical protein
MIDYGGTDFLPSGVPIFVSGDVQVRKDNGSFSNTVTLPTHVDKGIYDVTLASGEMAAAKIIVILVDQSSTKEFEDQAFVVETYGNASAEHQFDLDSDVVVVGDVNSAPANVIADHILRRTFQNASQSSDGDAKTGRSLLGAVAKLVNKISISGATLTIYEHDDSTSLFTQNVSSQAGANPIIALDTI